MPQTDLFGQPIEAKRRRTTPKKTTRTQNRAPGWQNNQDPTLFVGVLFTEDRDGVIDELPDNLRQIAESAIANLNQPVVMPSAATESDVKSVMSVVYRLRLEVNSQLYVPGDPQKPRDYVMSLTEICKLYQEEMLAERGFRSAAHGISEVKDSQGNVTGYRVQAWGDTPAQDGKIRTGHIHGGYCKTLDEAYKLRAEWWLKHRRIDISKMVCFSPDSAIAILAGMMRDAAINAGKECEWREITAAEIYGDDDD